MTSITRTKTAATLVAMLAIGAAGAPSAAAEQRALSPDQVYAYTCGHLGTSCFDAEAAKERAARKKKKAKRACSASKRRAAKRAGRKALRKYDRRCAAARKKGRRGGARR